MQHKPLIPIFVIVLSATVVGGLFLYFSNFPAAHSDSSHHLPVTEVKEVAVDKHETSPTNPNLVVVENTTNVSTGLSKTVGSSLPISWSLPSTNAESLVIRMPTNSKPNLAAANRPDSMGRTQEMFKVVTDIRTGDYAYASPDLQTVSGKSSAGNLLWSVELGEMFKALSEFWALKVHSVELVEGYLIVQFGKDKVKIEPQTGKIITFKAD
ncbi:MAG: hypothetical protein NTZ16_04355 [Verrucomicrobia bacterium]|nr:hypothetical protein [Verrucomicrobiota bacterium]